MKNSLTNFLKVADEKHDIYFHWPYLKSEKLLYIYKFYKAVVNLKTQTGINGCWSKFIIPHFYCSGIYCAQL